MRITKASRVFFQIGIASFGVLVHAAWSGSALTDASSVASSQSPRPILLLDRPMEIGGEIRSSEIRITPGAILYATRDLHLFAESVTVEGALLGSPGTERFDGVSIEIDANEITILGRIQGGSGWTPEAPPAIQACDAQGSPLSIVKGFDGGRGGSVRLRTSNAGRIRIAEGAVVASGSGGRGATAEVVAAGIPVGGFAENAIALGGRGGDAGELVIEAADLENSGTVIQADGGPGGDAYALAGNGAPDEFAGNCWTPASIGGYAVAFGGAGGASGEIQGPPEPRSREEARRLVAHYGAGRGGKGGDAYSTAGVTGATSMNPALIPYLARRDRPVVPCVQRLWEYTFVPGECRGVGGDGGAAAQTGGHGGAGGNATGSDAADPPIALNPGADGAASTQTGGAGTDGHCHLGFGSDGGTGGSATVGAGGDGSPGSSGCSMLTGVDTNNGGRGGDSTATGGRGGNAGCCLFDNGAGGSGGGATVNNGSQGGNGGCCSDGGRAGNLSATGGDGGDGENAGDGGNASVANAGDGGRGGYCPCPSFGPGAMGGDGGRGGSGSANGGSGGDGCSAGDVGGDGGNATTANGGDGGNAGNGQPAGTPGQGGSSSAVAGSSGSGRGGSGTGGSASQGSSGTGGAPGNDLVCPGHGQCDELACWWWRIAQILAKLLSHWH